MNISVTNRREIYRFIYSINQNQYVTHANGSSLLHLSMNDNTSADDYFIDRTCKYDNHNNTFKKIIYCFI
jgi:hypothetical protein